MKNNSKKTGLSKGKSPSKKKRRIFALVTFVLVLVVIEIGLHLVNYVTNLGPKDKTFLLPPYENADWARDYFNKELRECYFYEDYVQYLGWDRKEYHGKYINVDSEGRRKTWNPEKNDEENPKILYVFGGSTTWGTGARG